MIRIANWNEIFAIATFYHTSNMYRNIKRMRQTYATVMTISMIIPVQYWKIREK